MGWENLPEPVTRLGEWKVGRGGVELIVGGVNVELSAGADVWCKGRDRPLPTPSSPSLLSKADLLRWT